MPPNHTAQTSTEVKKAYKKNGPTISERTHKQLQRGYELEQRAAREREAEKRRKLSKEKRLEKERKEEQIRKQMGVGLATQLIGYSHTQANLKKGMEAFLGVSKKTEEKKRLEERRKEEELAKKLEFIAQDIEKEPFDDDDMDDVMLDLPGGNLQDGGNLVDDDLDDDTLLEVHDLIMSDPIEEPTNEPIIISPRPVTAPTTPQKKTAEIPAPVTISLEPKPPLAPTVSPKKQLPCFVKEGIEYTRIHGPINRVVEAALDKLPGELVELLSQDISTRPSDWDPAQGLLYKLNPVGLPPHRLRIKVGCVVVCLKDLNTSSQLSKSQHVRILRVENERLECLTLDGQLAGTKTVITRVPFPAKYRNDDRFTFTRTQYPVRVATDYISTDLPRESAQSGFKLPTINGKTRPPVLVKRPTPPANKPRSQVNSNSSFKLPGLPASRAQTSATFKPDAPIQTAASDLSALDGWDDFLESGTQIARELSAETTLNALGSTTVSRPPPVIESAPPLSTQDLDFSLDDLEDELQAPPLTVKTAIAAKAPGAPTKTTLSVATFKPPLSVRPGPLSRTSIIRRIDPEPGYMPSPSIRPQKSIHTNSKRPMVPPPKPPMPAKKPCVPSPRLAPSPVPTTTHTTTTHFDDFGMSTQEATSFFDDDDDFAFGSPPIAV
jgi:hypothetical protein